MARQTITSVSVSGMAREKINDNFEEVYADVAALEAKVGTAKDITISIPVASATTDGTEVTFTVVDADGDAVAARHTLQVWVSDDATGDGLTATNASGALTAVTGVILTALTAKKHILANTASTGILKLLLVDSANTAGERFCCTNPINGKLILGSSTTTASYEGGA